MTHEQKTAIARIISDMIKADNIIEESEIRFMKQLMTEYSLTSKEMCDARNMRFSEAVVVLQSRLSGFNFVYIPKMFEEFREMDGRYVKDVISYMAPHLPEKVVPDLIFLGQDMKTGRFRVAFRLGEGRERIVNRTLKKYIIYYQIAKKSCSGAPYCNKCGCDFTDYL